MELDEGAQSSDARNLALKFASTAGLSSIDEPDV
jgi:hypothetical protein